jgi:GDP/UDP-N,N'-diacetylbacillosamine 2-epimerase (hydrolysing)
LHTYCNLPRDAFTAILRYARCLAGNSSLGLHEAGYLGLPTVNVGERQKGRLSGDNVQFVPAEPAAVQAALERALNDKDYCQQIDCGSSPYGDGHMTERTVQILKDLPDRQQLLAKKLTF